MDMYEKYLDGLDHPTHPTLFLDLDAFNKNLNWVVTESQGKKIRIATKSLRSKEILKMILSSNEIFQGLMTFDLRESLWLRNEGFKDMLMGYPTVDKDALYELAKDPREIVLMVDLPLHIEMLEKIGKETSAIFEVCLDIDLSMDLPGVRFGVYRSKINQLQYLREIVTAIKSSKHVKLVGLMGYEAQIAGVMDKESFLMRLLKKISLRKLQRRRQEFLSYLHEQNFSLRFVNGGGTGSLKETRTETIVTEITVGSGFYSPVLFDHYVDFKLTPSLMFTLPIVRRPNETTFTCHGGGYIASGEIGLIKQPTPYLPHGAKLLKHEGAGEVQTPFSYVGPHELTVGKSIIMRHAKAGEVCERFDKIHVLKNGKKDVIISTYRGEGKTFV